MPIENVRFKPRDELLTFEEVERFVRVVAAGGVNKLRLTGGEPLLRNELPVLIRNLRSLPGVQDIALTTNGMLLPDHAAALRDAGLDRLNISLDTLSEETFQKIARRPGLQRVLDGIEAAMDCGFRKVRLNAIAMKDVTESEIVPLAKFAMQRDLELRFIEFMPLDAERAWEEGGVLTGAQIRNVLISEFGPLEPAARTEMSQPASDYEFLNHRGRIGFINSVSEPFCETCNRLRITAEGGIRNCLFSEDEWDARRLLRGDASDGDVLQLVRDCLAEKKRGHGRDDLTFLRPEKAMYQIGG